MGRGTGVLVAITCKDELQRPAMAETEKGIRLNGRYYPAEAFNSLDARGRGRGRSNPSGDDGKGERLADGLSTFQADGLSTFQADGIPDAVVEFLRQWWSPRTYITAHTSGSTGRPRVIRLSRTRMRASAQLTANFFQFTPGMPALLALDARHIAGKMMLVRAIISQLDLWVAPPSSRPDLLYPRQTFAFCPLVPTQLWRMLDAGADIERLGTILLGAAPIVWEHPNHLGSLKQEVYQGFGMTETCSHMAMRRIHPMGDGIYRGLPGVRWRVDQDGCLYLRGAATAHRWVHTNDRVEPIADGFRWLGRADWVINVGGIKVHPERVEERLSTLRRQIPELDGLLTGDFVVVGQTDPYKAEVPVCVVEDPTANYSPQNPNAAQIDPRYSPDWLKAHLKPEELPRKLLRIPQFPRTSLGKIIRRQILTCTI